jgi:hypothetical protein
MFSTVSPVRLAATSNSLAKVTVEFTSTPTAAAATVAPLTIVAVILLKSASTFFTDLSNLSTPLSVAFNLASIRAVLASSSTISVSVVIHYPFELSHSLEAPFAARS